MTDERRLTVVIDVESEKPEVIGTYLDTQEDTVRYTAVGGEIKMAPEDCVQITTIMFGGGDERPELTRRRANRSALDEGVVYSNLGEGIEVERWLGDLDGVPVVQIDGPSDKWLDENGSPRMRIYLNDSTIYNGTRA